MVFQQYFHYTRESRLGCIVQRLGRRAVPCRFGVQQGLDVTGVVPLAPHPVVDVGPVTHQEGGGSRTCRPHPGPRRYPIQIAEKTGAEDVVHGSMFRRKPEGSSLFFVAGGAVRGHHESARVRRRQVDVPSPFQQHGRYGGASPRGSFNQENRPCRGSLKMAGSSSRSRFSSSS